MSSAVEHIGLSSGLPHVGLISVANLSAPHRTTPFRHIHIRHSALLKLTPS